jgi:fatty acid desaturase
MTMQGKTPSISVDDKRGFTPQDPEMARRLKALGACNPVAPVGACLLDWAIILAAAAGSWAIFSAAGITVVSVVVYGIAAFMIASRQQGLQNLIHEASHYNLSRHRPWNDFLCWTATFLLHPFMDMEEQRRVHVRGHHTQFLDLPNDNIFRGYKMQGLDVLPLPSRWKSLAILGRGFFRSYRWQVLSKISPTGFLQSTGILGGLAGFGLLLALLALFPRAGFMSLTVWLLYWAVPAVVIVPAIMFVVVTSEHVSTFGTTEFERSRNKLGFLNRVLLHPHGDGFHMLHHLYPGIPHNHLARAHRLLMKDPVYRNGNHCYGLFFSFGGRRSVLRDLLEGPPRPRPSV